MSKEMKLKHVVALLFSYMGLLTLAPFILPYPKLVSYPTQEIRNLVALFTLESAKYLKHPVYIDDLEIKFIDKLSGGAVGDCTLGVNKTPVIRLLYSRWIKYPLAQKEQLLYHELGHCVLRRGHQPDHVTSIMQEALQPMNVYIKHRNLFLEELFSKRNEIE